MISIWKMPYFKKAYTVDVLSKKRVINNGIVAQDYVEISHEAIIPRELFMQTQNELKRRFALRKSKNKSIKKRVYSGQYALSNVLVCSELGDLYRRVTWNIKHQLQQRGDVQLE